MIAKHLLHLRLTRGWSQTQLAQQCGISRQRVSDYESGRYQPRGPSLERLLKALQQHQECPPLLNPEISKRTFPPLTHLDYNPVFEASWRRCSRAYWRQLRQLGFERFPAWFCAALPCDSALEYLAWALLVAAGATLCLASPVERGFDLHPLLNYLGGALGIRLRPCLQGGRNGLDWLLWPQIIIQPGQWDFRLDGLVLACRGGKRVWCPLEIDGPLHGLRDQSRDGQIHMEVLRFGSESIRNQQFPDLLEQRLLGELNKLDSKKTGT